MEGFILWMYRHVLQAFSYIRRLLDLDNEVHLWALHYVFMPIITKAINGFANGWNSHPLSSEKGYSPEQLWVLGSFSEKLATAESLSDVSLYNQWGFMLMNNNKLES